MRLFLPKQTLHRLPFPILRHIKRSLLDFAGQPWTNAEGSVDGGVQVFDGDAALDGAAGTLVGGDAVDVAAFQAAAEHQHAAGGGEVAVHARSDGSH